MARPLKAPAVSYENENRGNAQHNSTGTADVFDCVTQDGSFQKLPKRTQSRILGTFGFFLFLCLWVYLTNGDIDQDKIIEDMVIIKPPHRLNATTGDGTNFGENEKPKRDYGLHEGLLSTYPIISINSKDGVQSSPIEIPVVGDGGKCPALCDSREQARNTKFGGDLLDLSNVVQMANKAHDKLVDHIKLQYGDYFDGIFIKDPAPNTTTPRKYAGMEPVTPDGKSRHRLKRKLQLKVLKMMEALKLAEENVHGCNCRTKTGSTNENEDAFTSSIPDYYQKYVFANGGHSNAAGHGNVFSETYTHYIGEDLRIIWDALGVEMINRNMAMGAMR